MVFVFTEVSRLAMVALEGGDELVDPLEGFGATVEPTIGEAKDTTGRNVPGSATGTKIR
jgi:hypothetical protein